jgi:hypothetical protein
MTSPRHLWCAAAAGACGIVALLDAFASDGITVGGGGGSTQINVCGQCRQVTNYNGPSIYVPTSQCGEWSSFYDHAPGGVGIGSCFTPICVPSGFQGLQWNCNYDRGGCSYMPGSCSYGYCCP